MTKVKIINILNLLLSLAAILFLAFLIKDYLVLKYIPSNKMELSKRKQVPPAADFKREFSYYAPVLEKGIFAPADKLTFIDKTIFEDGRLSNENPVEKMIALVGTVVLPSRKSYAVFEEASSKKQDVFKENEEVFGIGILKEVKKNKAYIIIGNRKTEFNMPIAVMIDSVLPEEQHLSQGFPLVSQKIGEREWMVDRRALSKTLEDMSKLLTDGRLLPYKEGDRIIGFRVNEIKPDGVFSIIGLKNSDILLRVNNYEVDSAEKGIQLLTGLKGESNISLDIIRDGKRMNMNYRVR